MEAEIEDALDGMGLARDASLLDKPNEEIVRDYKDEFGVDLMGVDKDERERLQSLNEVEREAILAERAEKRLAGERRVTTFRGFLDTLRQRRDGAAGGDDSDLFGGKGRGRKRQLSPRKKPAAAAKPPPKKKPAGAKQAAAKRQAVSSGEEGEDEDDLDEEGGAEGDSGPPSSSSDDESDSESDSDSDSDDSSESESESEDESEEEADGEEIEVPFGGRGKNKRGAALKRLGGRRLRQTAARDRAAAASCARWVAAKRRSAWLRAAAAAAAAWRRPRSPADPRLPAPLPARNDSAALSPALASASRRRAGVPSASCGTCEAVSSDSASAKHSES